MSSFEFGTLPTKKGIKQIILTTFNHDTLNFGDPVYLDPEALIWKKIRNLYTTAQGFYINNNKILIKGLITNYGNGLTVGTNFVQIDDTVTSITQSAFKTLINSSGPFLYCGIAINDTDLVINLQELNGSNNDKAGYLPSDSEMFSVSVTKLNFTTENIFVGLLTLPTYKRSGMGASSPEKGYIIGGQIVTSSQYGPAIVGTKDINVLIFASEIIQPSMFTLNSTYWSTGLSYNRVCAYIFGVNDDVGILNFEINKLAYLNYTTSVLLNTMTSANQAGEYASYQYSSTIQSEYNSYTSLYQQVNLSVNQITKFNFISESLFYSAASVTGITRILSIPSSYDDYGFYIGGEHVTSHTVYYNTIDKFNFNNDTLNTTIYEINGVTPLVLSGTLANGTALTSRCNTFICGGYGTLSNATKVRKYDPLMQFVETLTTDLQINSYYHPQQHVINK